MSSPSADSDHKEQQNGRSLDDVFLSDIIGAIPEYDYFYNKEMLPTYPSPYEALLHEELSSSSQTVGFPSPNCSPFHSPVTPDICNTLLSVPELLNGTPEDVNVVSFESCSDLYSNIGEPMDKDILYTALTTQQTQLCNSRTSEMDVTSDTWVDECFQKQSGDYRTVKKEKYDFNDGFGDYAEQIREDFRGERTETADIELTANSCISDTSCIGLSPPQIQQMGHMQAVTNSSDETLVVDTEFFHVAKDSNTRCNHQHCDSSDSESIKTTSLNHGNSEWNPVDEIFHMPIQLHVKSIDSGAANETRGPKLSKEKKCRRKSNCFFEGISAPLPKRSKESSVTPVESVTETYTQDEKENRCEDSLFHSLNENLLPPSSHSKDPADVNIVDRVIVNNESKPDYVTVRLSSARLSAKRNRRRKSACLNTVTENYTLSDLNSDQTDRVNPDLDNSEKEDFSMQTSFVATRKRRKSADFSCVLEASEKMGYACTQSRRRSFEMGRQHIIKQMSDSVESGDGIKSADLQSSGLARTSETKPEKVKLHRTKKEENLEKLYRNKNFKMPTKKTWETIFEDPHNGNLVGKKKQNRILLFETITAVKQKRRQQKASKLGWGVTGRNSVRLPDEYVTDIINAIAEDLASTDCS